MASDPMTIFTVHLKWYLSCSHFFCTTSILGSKSEACILREYVSEGKEMGDLLGAGRQQGSNNLKT